MKPARHTAAEGREAMSKAWKDCPTCLGHGVIAGGNIYGNPEKEPSKDCWTCAAHFAAVREANIEFLRRSSVKLCVLCCENFEQLADEASKT